LYLKTVLQNFGGKTIATQRIIFAVLLLAWLLLPSRGTAKVGVKVVYDCDLPDIGMATTDRRGRPVIVWNSCKAQLIDPLVAQFFWQHELGHIYLGHIYLDTVSEDAADAYAVETLRHTNPQAIFAFIDFKARQGLGGCAPRHRCGADRARFVASRFYGRQTPSAVKGKKRG
jgi:hypothetical protein